MELIGEEVKRFMSYENFNENLDDWNHFTYLPTLLRQEGRGSMKYSNKSGPEGGKALRNVTTEPYKQIAD